MWIQTVKLGPYPEYELRLRRDQLARGENVLEVAPVKLWPDLSANVNLVKIELRVTYGDG